LENVIIEDYEGTSHISLFFPCSHLFLGDILFEKESSKTETLQKEMGPFKGLHHHHKEDRSCKIKCENAVWSPDLAEMGGLTFNGNVHLSFGQTVTEPHSTLFHTALRQNEMSVIFRLCWLSYILTSFFAFEYTPNNAY
jgi:hypothetical protein